MTEELNDTIKKFPRTLGEAFPNDPSNAQWLHAEKPEHSTWSTVLVVIGVIAWALFFYYLVCLMEMKK